MWIANDLVALDGNNAFDIFRRDMVTGRTTRISVDTGGGSPNGNSFGGEMSPDGRYIRLHVLGERSRSR